MKGMQTILTNRAFTLEELDAFMREHWDTEPYSEFQIGKPTPLAAAQAIMLPATPHFVVLAAPVAAGGLFSRKNKVMLSTAKNEAGFSKSLASSLLMSTSAGAAGLAASMPIKREASDPAEEILLKYTEYMRELLGKAGYLAN